MLLCFDNFNCLSWPIGAFIFRLLAHVDNLHNDGCWTSEVHSESEQQELLFSSLCLFEMQHPLSNNIFCINNFETIYV